MGVKTRLLASGKTEDNEFNISLLGFKMAVNEGLTVFNLVDGIVDEFNDESGTDEAEGSNDRYCGTSDYYINSTQPGGVGSPAVSAGFTTSSTTEDDTSEAGTNPAQGAGCYGTFTVGAGLTSLGVKAWGAGATGQGDGKKGGGGGFTTGTIAVSPGQVLEVIVGETSTSPAMEPGPSPDANLPTAGEQSGNEALGGGGADFGPCLHSGGGAGLSGVITNCEGFRALQGNAPKAPQVYIVAGGGGTVGYTPQATSGGGAGGGTTGQDGRGPNPLKGTGGTQTAGGQSREASSSGVFDTNRGSTGKFLEGGDAESHGPRYGPSNKGLPGGAGGAGYYGGGGGSATQGYSAGGGGGGSSYFAHPQVTSGSTEGGDDCEGGGTADPAYVACTNEGTPGPYSTGGEDGYVLLTASAVCASATSATIISNAFAANSVPTLSRIVVFQEDLDTPTLNTDIIASISRDGGSNFTTATLTDSGYVTGSSGQRILTGQAVISGQPSGQSMRWKLALANNAVKIHGVSLQWS